MESEINVTEAPAEEDIRETVEEALDEGEIDVANEYAGMSKLAMLRELVSTGMMSGAQARQMRAAMGIRNSSFTRKQTTASQRKNKRKLQKKARKANRK